MINPIIQYNVDLSVTGTIRGRSQTKLQYELGLESLKFKRWMGKLCMFFKIKTLKIPKYLYFLMPSDCAFLSTKGFAR